MISDVSDLTRRMRSDDDPAWARLRCLLDTQGIDVNDVALAEFVDIADEAWMGILVARERVVEFAFGIDDSVFADWIQLTSWWRDTPYRDSVEQAFRLLGAQSS